MGCEGGFMHAKYVDIQQHLIAHHDEIIENLNNQRKQYEHEQTMNSLDAKINLRLLNALLTVDFKLLNAEQFVDWCKQNEFQYCDTPVLIDERVFFSWNWWESGIYDAFTYHCFDCAENLFDSVETWT